MALGYIRELGTQQALLLKRPGIKRLHQSKL